MRENYLGIIFTKHSINRLYNRRVSQSQVVNAIKKPDFKYSAKTSGAVKFRKDYRNYSLYVVAKQNKNKQWVIMTSWLRDKRRKSHKTKTSHGFLIRLLKFFGL